MLVLDLLIIISDLCRCYGDRRGKRTGDAMLKLKVKSAVQKLSSKGNNNEIADHSSATMIGLCRIGVVLVLQLDLKMVRLIRLSIRHYFSCRTKILRLARQTPPYPRPL